MGLRSPVAAGCAVVLMVAAVAAPRALEAQGVIEINQTIVNAAGGFPFKISAVGSYQLTSNLTVPTAGVNAIDVVASPVTIDLNGFTITGAAGDGDGVYDNTGALTLQNGKIEQFDTGTGVSATVGPTIISDLSTANTTDGLTVNNARVTRYSAGSVSVGVICTGNNCILSGATINAIANGVNFSSTGAASLIDSQIKSGGDGVHVSGPAIVVGNTITLTGTGVAGIRFLGGGGYGQNTIVAPTGSVCVSGGTSMGDNACNGAKQ